MKTTAIIRIGLVYAAIGFVTFELAARVEDLVRYGAPFWKAYTIETLFQPSEFGRSGRPNARYAKWSLNSLGYRGPEPVPGRINVVTFGASETFGLYESPGNEFPRQLERELARHPLGPTQSPHEEKRFQVINIAVPGISIGKVNYLELAEERLAPRYLVIYPSPANYIGITSPFCGRPPAPEPTTISPLDHVRILGKVRDLSKRVIPPDMLAMARAASLRLNEHNHDVMQAVPEATIDAIRDDLACVAESAKRHDVRIVLVTHPTFFGLHRGVALSKLDRQQLSAWRRFYPKLAESGFLDLERRTDAALRAYAAEAGLSVVDAAAEVPPGPAYFADFVHLTDLGAATVARLVARTIANDERRVFVAAAQDPPRDDGWRAPAATLDSMIATTGEDAYGTP
jgi:hypothetical protein